MKFFLKNLVLTLFVLGSFQGFASGELTIPNALKAAHIQTHASARQNPMMLELFKKNMHPDRYLQYLSNLDVLFEELEKRLATRTTPYVPEGLKRSHQLKAHMNTISDLTRRRIPKATPDARILGEKIRLQMGEKALTSMAYLLYGAVTHGGQAFKRTVKNWLVKNHNLSSESTLPFYEFNENGPKLFNILKERLPQNLAYGENKRREEYQSYFNTTYFLNTELLEIFSSAYNVVPSTESLETQRVNPQSKYIDNDIATLSPTDLAIGATLVWCLAFMYYAW